MEKLEKQVVKLRSRWRDTHRDPKATRATKESAADVAPVAPEQQTAKAAKLLKPSVNGKAPKAKVFRVSYDQDTKPMTLEEAVLAMEEKIDYVVYRDCDHSGMCVLLRRRDGHFDLIES